MDREKPVRRPHPFTRRIVSTMKYLTILCFFFLSIVSSIAIRPNIVFILSDDQGWNDIGYHGSEIRTPNLDRLATLGVKLEQFYVQPVCTPTRGALMSGQYPMRLGLQLGVIKPGSGERLPLSVKSLPQILSEAGYFTAMTGKWHLGNVGREYLPTSRGFDHQHGFYLGSIDYFTHERDGGLDWHRNDHALIQSGYSTDLIGDEAVSIIEKQTTEKPFFLYVPFNAPHTPLQAKEEDLARYSGIENTKRRTFAAMVTCLDQSVGRIAEALERKGLSENTLLIFSSDNGGNLPAASNYPLRDEKGSLYEGGVRVPAFVVWPGKLPAGKTVNQPLHMVDWYPTLARLAGARLPEGVQLDGRDLWPALTGEAGRIHEEILINAAPGIGALRRGDWKLVINGHLKFKGTSPGPVFSWADVLRDNGEPPELAEIQKAELFNLATDPEEKTDLAPSHPEVVRDLKARFQTYADQAAPLQEGGVPSGFKTPAVWGEFPAGRE